MNFLGHAVLGFDEPELIVGNMIADYVKGRKILETFPEGIKQGILLHRKIDAFTDHHPQTLKLKIYFRPAYRLYAGPCVDHLYDHYLANDPYYFSNTQALLDFEQKVFKLLDEYEAVLPETFKQVLFYMKQGQWLSDVKKIKGLERSFKRLERMGKYMPDASEAYTTSIGHYYEMNQRFFDFMEDVRAYAKLEIENYNPALS